MNTQQIFDVIENYLVNQKSNNALLITGEWGIGKTFFMKNQIKPKIQKLDFDVLYISVNGLNSIEQLKRIILSIAIEEKLKEDKEGNQNGLKKIRNSVAEGFSKLLKAFNNSEAGSTLKNVDKTGMSSLVYSTLVSMIEPLSHFNFEKKVLCFDDIERISSNLKIEDLFGFINTEFVEHKGYKVILIGDDTKNQLLKEDFKKNKEKLVGWTLEYKPVLKDVFDSIMDIYKKENDFYVFLTQNKDFLIGVIQEIQVSNLRILLFILDCLKRILSVIDSTIDEVVKKEIIYFTIVISIEYKGGNLPKKISKYSNIRSKGRFVIFHNEKEVPEKEELAYESKFQKYRSNLILEEFNLEYNFFESIYNFINTGFLQNLLLEKEIALLLEDKNNTKLDKDEILVNNLGGFPYLTNSDFTNKLDEVYGKIEKNSLSLYNYLLLCQNLFRLESYGLLNYNKKELSDIFFIHYPMILNKYKNEREDFHILRFFSEIKKYDDALVNQFEAQYKSFKNILDEQAHITYLNNWDIGYNSSSTFHELINTVPPNKIADKLLEKISDRNYMSRVVTTIQKSYNSINEGQHRYAEKIKLENLCSILIELKDAKGLILIDKYIFNEIIEALQKAIKHLEVTK